MSNEWIKLESEKPNVGMYCLTLSKDDSVELALYTADKDGDYFSPLGDIICDKFGYDHEFTYGELTSVEYWYELPKFKKE